MSLSTATRLTRNQERVLDALADYLTPPSKAAQTVDVAIETLERWAAHDGAFGAEYLLRAAGMLAEMEVERRDVLANGLETHPEITEEWAEARLNEGIAVACGILPVLHPGLFRSENARLVPALDVGAPAFKKLSRHDLDADVQLAISRLVARSITA